MKTGLLSTLLLLPMLVFAQDQVFHEKDGLVVIEAESVPLGEDWAFRSGTYQLKEGKTVAGYTGDGVYHFIGNSETNGPATGAMEYRIKITNAGTYRLYMHGMEAPIESGKGDRANDCYIKMEGQSGCEGKFTKFVRLGKSFVWTFDIQLECSHHSFSHPIYELDAGEHVFSIAGRSKNFLVDRMVFVKEGSDHEPKNLFLQPSEMTGTVITHSDTAPQPELPEIVSPAAGADLVMGSTVMLEGKGENISWSYDANSDNLGEVAIGEGKNVEFQIPTDITGPKELTLKMASNGTEVTATYQLVTEGTSITYPHAAKHFDSGEKSERVYDAMGSRSKKTKSLVPEF